ncbi:InlB B-repeat-containing protein [Dickeya fangzhongdai]|uniref:pectate lyase family protein n=1 Tax=Dickeya fangzhongdai TaxID=1778540 RepID=UPI000675C915|nr:hypothetical protein [Dickeya fangzhongdai]
MNNNTQRMMLSASPTPATGKGTSGRPSSAIRRGRVGIVALSMSLLAALPAWSTAATTYTLTLNASSQGAITGAASGINYPAGTQLTLKASPYGSYGVKTWTGDAAACGSSDTCTLTMNDKKTVGLEFKSAPVGFGAGVTGGADGDVVTVTTPDELKRALCDNVVDGVCKDATPRVIQLKSVIDFSGLEGTRTDLGCTYSNNSCAVNGKMERILSVANYCDGKPTYNITYDAAGKTPLLIGSNKTLIGVGKNAGIKGKGVIMRGGVSNVIVRNLSITDINESVIWAGDAISIDNASRIWIDHNYISRIGRQMIVTGWGIAANVTISNNFLDGTTEAGHYCDNRHYWMMLLVAENQSITLIGNRIYNSAGRSPEIGKQSSATNGGIVHLVNNLFDSNYYMGIRGHNDAIAFVEGNYFVPGNRYFLPIFLYGDTPDKNKMFATLDANIGAQQSTCRSVLGRDCVSNFATANTDKFIVNPDVMSDIKASESVKKALGSVAPVSYSQVKSMVENDVGPQNNPDL